MFRQRQRNRHVIGLEHELFALLGSEKFFRNGAIGVAEAWRTPSIVATIGGIALECQDAHPERLREPRRFASDRSISDDAEGLAAQFLDRARKSATLPFVLELRAE